MKSTVYIDIEEVNSAIKNKTTEDFCLKLLVSLSKTCDEHKEKIVAIAEKQKTQWEMLRREAESNGGWVTRVYLRRGNQRDLLKLLTEGMQREVLNHVGMFQFNMGKWWLKHE